MSTVNKVILLGHLGKDPESKSLPSGQKMCSFSIATSEQWKDQSGQKQERTDWHNIVVWAKLAELCETYLQKGSEVYLEGKLSTRSWDDKDGKKQYRTEVTANEVKFISGNRKKDSGGSAQNGGAPPDDDIPF